MASGAVETERINDIGDNLVTMSLTDGSAAHRYWSSAKLRAGAESARNLADAIHLLSALHGRHPGVIDFAAEKTALDAPRDWLLAAAEAFAVERAYLTRLVVAVGPLPGTPGQAETEAVIIAQRHALEMLAQSDRTGCALGAAFALVLDWAAVRELLDITAERFGIDRPACRLPRGAQTRLVASAVAQTAAVERALGFGSQQILVQHHGLWDLLEAREAARRGS